MWWTTVRLAQALAGANEVPNKKKDQMCLVGKRINRQCCLEFRSDEVAAPCNLIYE